MPRAPRIPGSSVFRDVEREQVSFRPAGRHHLLRDAAAVLREIGIDGRTLLKIDIEGAEYEVLRVIAPLLAEHKPWLHISFHPFNLVARGDAYQTALLRVRCALTAAEALALLADDHSPVRRRRMKIRRPGGADGFPAAILIERQAGAADCNAAIRICTRGCLL